MEDNKIYDTPYVGCLMGAAFQRQINKLEAALKQKGLNISASEYMILRALYYKDGLQQCEIVEMVGKDKASICRSVAAMGKKELIRTEPVSYKCIRVWLSEKAIEIKPQIMTIADKCHTDLLNLAPQKDIEAFVRVLKAILK